MMIQPAFHDEQPRKPYSDDGSDEENGEHTETSPESREGGLDEHNEHQEQVHKSWRPSNMCLIVTGIIFIAVIVGASVGTKAKRDRESSSSSSEAVNNGKGPSPTASPVSAPTKATGPSYESFSGVMYPPGRDPHLPDYVNPATSLGHVVAMNSEGGQFAAAAQSSPNDPDHFYGGFHLYRFDVEQETFTWTQTVYEQTTNPPPAKATRIQALSMHGGRVAFTQGNRVSVYFQSGAGEGFQYRPLGQDISDFVGPDPNALTKYHPVQVALSPSALLLAVLLASDGGTPGLLEIYGDSQKHLEGGLVDTWDRVAQIQLPEEVDGGSMAFSFYEQMLAVGTYKRDASGMVTEMLHTYAAFSSGWVPAGNPKAVADSFLAAPDAKLGGSVVSMSRDGTKMAVGSMQGKLNKVVLLRWNAAAAEWEAYGSNNVIVGDMPTSEFGASVQLSSSSDSSASTRLFVGAPGDSKVFLYHYNPTTNVWAPATPAFLQSDESGDSFGESLAIDPDGSHLVVGMPQRTDPNPSATAVPEAFRPGAVIAYQLQQAS